MTLPALVLVGVVCFSGGFLVGFFEREVRGG